MLKKTILLLKCLFGITIFLCAMQLFFVLNPSLPMKTNVELFALRVPITTNDKEAMHAINWYILICSLPLYTLSLYIFKKLIDIMKPLSRNITPFTSNSFNIVKHIGYACFLYGLVSKGIEYIGANVLMSHINNALPELSTQFSLPVIPIVAGILLLLLAEVFDKGLKLQEDNDSII